MFASSADRTGCALEGSDLHVAQTLIENEIRADADKFLSAVRRRNRVEYTAAVFVIAVFVAYIWIFPTPLMRLGSLLIIAAAILIMVWIHFRASANPIPSHISFMDYLYGVPADCSVR